jgi:hypothetical protein
LRPRRACAAAALVTASIAGGRLHAASGVDVGPPADAPPQSASGIEQVDTPNYWERGMSRVFLSASLELGFAYVRPQIAFGYGRPHWSWIGLEAWPVAGPGGFGTYAGVRAALPNFSIRSGARYYRSFGRTFLPAQASFDRLDLDTEFGPDAQYLALEAEATGSLDLPAGSLFAVATGYHVRGLPESSRFPYLFEESLKVVIEPPYVWRGRLGYLLGFGRERAIRIGIASDLIGVPGREAYIVRAGLIGSVVMTAHLEAQAAFIPVLVSPDSIGLAGGDFGQLGVRFRWATDAPLDTRRTDSL